MNKPLITEVYSTCTLYGLLLWYTLALFPFFPGLDIGPTVTLAFLFWLGTLLAGRLRPLWRWGGFALLAAGNAALAPHLYRCWRNGTGCPGCFEEEWGVLCLHEAHMAPWILWAFAMGSLFLGLLLPAPRWRWQGAQEGEINLLPRLAAALILVWPMFLAAFLLWSLLPRTLLG